VMTKRKELANQVVNHLAKACHSPSLLHRLAVLRRTFIDYLLDASGCEQETVKAIGEKRKGHQRPFTRQQVQGYLTCTTSYYSLAHCEAEP